ncbi:unnamed protein product [Sphenostylis stenocarpa]|uniref:Uncharacterized protein n=1 Tax=Sphenostylis stenocarpa TaxID=92480 RepID=A0AA86T195_9FABA|nr:unnamed protein product [Sphenostylis stenocarpa]
MHYLNESLRLSNLRAFIRAKYLTWHCSLLISTTDPVKILCSMSFAFWKAELCVYPVLHPLPFGGGIYIVLTS